MAAAMDSTGDLALTQAMNTAVAGRTQAPNPNTHNLDKAAQDFEGMFMAQMLQPMFDTVKVDPLFGGGHGEEVMRGFLVQEYGKVMAKHGNLGIAAYIKNAMIQAQGKATIAAASKRTMSMVPPAPTTPAPSGVTP